MAFNALKEVQAKGLQLVQDDLLVNLATKQDLDLVRKALDTKIDNIGKDLKAWQGTQTLQLLGGVAALLVIFRFLSEFFR